LLEIRQTQQAAVAGMPPPSAAKAGTENKTYRSGKPLRHPKSNATPDIAAAH